MKQEKAGEYIEGNSIALLSNGDEFFPRLLKRIRSARQEIFIETFILADDRVGRLFKKALIQAARRGVWVAVTVDSYGSFYLPDKFIQALIQEGVVFQIFDPQPDWLNARPRVFRRLHRKLAVIDGQVGFVGGINLCADHLAGNPDIFKRDYAVEVTGPAVQKFRQLCASYVREADTSPLQHRSLEQGNSERAGPTPVKFVSRDNRGRRTTIEREYVAAIRAAKKRVYIANAYFFPGYRMMRALRRAARRGVDVRVVVQGNPDISFTLKAARALYTGMTEAGIRVYEYTDTPLHAKIAVIDDKWATVGSSNLDPWSLSFNLEANIFTRDDKMNTEISKIIDELMATCRVIEAKDWVRGRAWWQHLKDTCIYHLLRWIPQLINSVPNGRPKIRLFQGDFLKNRQTHEGRSKSAADRKRYPESRHARQLLHTQDFEL